MDYRRNSHHPVAARFFGWKHQRKLSENRRLDPYFDRYRRHPHHFETIGDRRVLDFHFATVQVEAVRQAASTRTMQESIFQKDNMVIAGLIKI